MAIQVLGTRAVGEGAARASGAVGEQDREAHLPSFSCVVPLAARCRLPNPVTLTPSSLGLYLSVAGLLQTENKIYVSHEGM